MALYGQVREEGRDLLGAKQGRVLLSVEEDKLLNPEDVVLFGAVAVVAGAHQVADLIEEFWHGRLRLGGDGESRRKGGGWAI